MSFCHTESKYSRLFRAILVLFFAAVTFGLIVSAGTVHAAEAEKRTLRIEFDTPSPVYYKTEVTELTIGGEFTYELEDDPGLIFTGWTFSSGWEPAFKKDTSAASLCPTVVIPDKTKVSGDLVMTAHFKTDSDLDLTAQEDPFSFLESVTFNTDSVKKGSIFSVTLSFSREFTNGRLRITMYDDVKDGSKGSQTVSYTRNISNGKVTYIKCGSSLYAGTVHVLSIELFASDDKSYSNQLAILQGADPRLTAHQLTITGGDPVKTNVTDKGVTDEGVTETKVTDSGDNKSVSAGKPGAGVARTEAAITTSAKEDFPGASFAPLKAYSKKTGSKSVTLKWSKVSGASGYIVYGNRCGKKNKFKKLKETTGTSFTHTKLKKGTFYKYIVVAFRGKGASRSVLSTSATVHVTTKGGKYTNYKSIKPKKTSIKLKVGKSYTLKIKSTAKVTKSKKLKKHRAILFEDDNPGVVRLSGKGKITALKKGTAVIYAYAQNGVYKKITVKVS